MKFFVSSISLKYENETADPVDLYKIMTPGITFGFGKQKVIMDRITLNYGVQFSLPLNVIQNQVKSLLADYSLKTDEDDLIATGIYRNATKTAFEFRLGLGFLAF